MTTIAIHQYPGRLSHETRAAAMVWRREMIRFRHDTTRMLAMLLQPVLFLFVMGTGLASVVDTGGAVDFRTFLFPGVLAMSVLFSAAFAGISLVWDREFGFLREMLVAPVSQASIIVGKCLGGATTATVQSVVLLVLAGFVGVPYHPLLLLELLALLFVGSFLLTAIGLLLSARVKQIQSAMPTMQLIITPMMFLSGALFPMANLPGWLAVLTKLNPLTYVVQPMRSVVYGSLDLPASATATVDSGIDWWGWQVPVAVQVLVAVGCAGVVLAAAIAAFDRTD
ncbi:ABC transporter permease [Stackebrandtia nassauensis]|uniref:Transport permease protein n=1 Tax=Stackebrandtia nassauensis (strain DSM 44728 / CIP 108903 / NRRL B-16338 / NBRC 102104 / LLR-40K-21) TaxID=446470 RepID=D3QAU2_STANL|nr:ABC transporter permease [Stackebrandtia nassauensis]ADD44738.1 ABC-2 type transporter [Stackebrandtia nassauensis DSM 44728]